MNSKNAPIYRRKWSPVLKALSDEQLNDPIRIQDIAITCLCIQYGTKYISRRSLPDVTADVWRDFKGTALNSDGSVFELGDFDAVLGGANDTEFTWLREFFAYALTPPQRNLSSETKARIRLIELTIRAGGPALWRNLKPIDIDDLP